ncbi:MAG: right-handed parallel beta-helix repeat-containing protein [Alphaproteobacteria bacterium]|nr:right-handed parallel beta-helix repeat-containing protein [Alphaproteobacteria bacterium]
MRQWLITLVAIIACAAAARAETIVRQCGSDVEPGAMNLATALAIGGRIRFACPGGSSTIAMTRDYDLQPGIELNGEGRITLDAQGRQLHMFRVSAGNISLRNISIRNARVRQTPFRRRPSILDVNDGELRLENVTISNSESPINTQRADIRDSKFRRNIGTALYVSGTGKVANSFFTDNDTGLGLRGGSLERSSFIDNRSAALTVHYPLTTLLITGNQFRRNGGRGAVVLSQRSHRDGGSQTVRFRRNLFQDNTSMSGGGAISIIDTVALAPAVVQPALSQFPPSRFEFWYDRFSSNHGQGGGAIGARLENTLGMRIYGGIFVSNTSDGKGGAVSWSSAAVDIRHSVFLGNSAFDGGALFADFQAPGARWVISNSLFSRNAADSGGGIIAIGPVELYNVTVARNTGTGFAGDIHGSGPERPLIANSILADNSAGNCRGIARERFRGRNFQFGGDDCEGVEVADPIFDSYLVPQLGSPVLAGGDIQICRNEPVSGKDLVFQSRALQGHCAAGAFEYEPKSRIFRFLGQRDD